ncbi:GNAT family N-acetyltransferase [Tianweitania sp.]|uniref:GNAT family N-acetyltransferase n=1 Tax=Tianweitania sp. TaxID=2021634 RepID=UPI002898F6C5|nr:GNAT family N-acetyltransferase [Tianweitania sp.]
MNHVTFEFETGRLNTGVPLSVAPSATLLPLGKIGSLEARLATSEAEIEAAQKLRFSVFYEELGATRQEAHRLDQRDADRFDSICDHLLVFDTALPGPSAKQIVGCYRLLRQETADATGGFYSADEFEFDKLVARHPDLNFLELGRSCVLPAYRSKRTIELLWQAIWAYVKHHGIDVMAGCASFHGTIPAAHAEALSFLAHNCTGQDEWAVRAVAKRFAPMDLMPAEAINAKAALTAMPPLVKGYLRLGAKFGEGCVVDHDFGTTDVFVVLPISAISERYITYYGGAS